MAVLQTIRNFFIPARIEEPEIIVSAPPTTYEIRPLTVKHLKEVLRLNIRCFKKGENYTKHTFNYLLNLPNGLSYRIITAEKDIVGFIFVSVSSEGVGHITTIGVAPEHRRRGLAVRLLQHAENALLDRGINTVVLEVRVGNVSAQNLYRACGYAITQRVPKYYTNGEDCFIMVKPLF
jgi:[ribosomal protein S18]-alanine N-acetyltransferase